MRMDLRLIFICAFSLVGVSNEKIDNVKICVVADPKSKPGHVTKYCDQLSRSKKTPVTCVYAADRLDCLRVVSRRDADFTVMEPEDLYFSTLWPESAILVVSEVRAVQDAAFKYGTVVVVRNGLNGTSGVNLRGRKLCHPGMKSGSDWNDLFAEYLEERLAPRNCEPDKTVFEDRIKTSADFFGDSCKAGPWTDDQEEDRRLKGDYPTLCAICEMGDCSNSEKYRGSEGSLLCLTDGVGDVLWARYEYVRTYFKKFTSEDSISASDYSLLCEDGSFRPLDTRDPCYWLAMPWQVIAANRKSANEVQKVFHQFGDGDDWEKNLIEVIVSYLHYIVNLQVPKTPEDYLKNVPGYLSAVEMSQGNCKPKHTVKLCTSSPVEQSKCSWMSNAALSVALEPVLECVEKPNMTSCLESVSSGDSDVVVVPPDYAAGARTKYGLTTLYTELPNQENNGYIVSAVVRENSNMKSLLDLKHKEVCFTAPNGVGWNGALQILHEVGLISGKCREKDLLEFFGGVCAVRNGTGDDERVRECCRDDGSSHTDEMRALRCLARGKCDVAFLDEHTATTVLGDSSSRSVDFKSKSFRTVDWDEKSPNSPWAWAYPSYLMINSNASSVKFQEVRSLFHQMGDVFGRKSKNDNKILEIFGPFNGLSNVIFEDTSVSFAKSDHWHPKNDYQGVMDDLSLCSGSSMSRALGSLSTVFLICILIEHI